MCAANPSGRLLTADENLTDLSSKHVRMRSEAAEEKAGAEATDARAAQKNEHFRVRLEEVRIIAKILIAKIHACKFAHA